MKYSCYEYEIETWVETNNPNEVPRYVYKIYGSSDATVVIEESCESYRTIELAYNAAKERMEVLEDALEYVLEYEGNYEECMAMKSRAQGA